MGLFAKESRSTGSGQSAADKPHKVAPCSETAGTKLLPASPAPPQTPKHPVMLPLQRAMVQELAHTFAKLHPKHSNIMHCQWQPRGFKWTYISLLAEVALLPYFS